MEIVGFILFLILIFVSASDKKKKRNSAAAKPGMPAGVQRRTAPRPAKPVAPASAIRGRAEELKATLDQWTKDTQAGEASHYSEPVIQPVNRHYAGQGESMLEDADCAGGSMAHTHNEGHSALQDEDCVGGSMAHSHSEGVSRADHARRMAAIDAEQGDSNALTGTIDARALRRAVIMAEVLGKPRALRRQR